MLYIQVMSVRLSATKYFLSDSTIRFTMMQHSSQPSISSPPSSRVLLFSPFLVIFLINSVSESNMLPKDRVGPNTKYQIICFLEISWMPSPKLYYLLSTIWIPNPENWIVAPPPNFRKSQMDQIPITNSAIQSQQFVYWIIQIICSNSAKGGQGLAFIAYPEALSSFPSSSLPWLWSALFFLMLFFLGIDSEFAFLETIFSAIYDAAPSLR